MKNISTQFVKVKATAQYLKRRKTIFGVGINDADYVVKPTIDGKRLTCPYFQVWASMLARCFRAETQTANPTYKNCTICDGWLSFMAFRKWMQAQDWEGKQIDKDILILGNKHYSPETCLFVTSAINNLLTDSPVGRGEWPQGVRWHKRCKKFEVRIMCYGKSKYLGNYTTSEAAAAVYRKAKRAYIQEVAEQQIEPLRSALYGHADSV